MSIANWPSDNGVWLKWMCDRAVQELVSCSGEEAREAWKRLQMLKPGVSFSFPAVLLAEAAGEAPGEGDSLRFMERIRDKLQEAAPQGSLVFVDQEGRAGLIFSWLTGDIPERVRARLAEGLRRPVTVGVGNPCRRPAELHVSHREARRALLHKFYAGAGRVIPIGEVGAYAESCAYPAGREEKLFELLRAAAGREEVEAGVRAFYDEALRNGPVPVRRIREITVRLLAGLEKRLCLDAGAATAHHELLSALEMETLEQLRDFAVRYLLELTPLPGGEKNKAHRSIIGRTLYYMEQECRDATLDSMARKVYVTPTYLSMLFKVNTGKTFIEQLTEIRIRKAKDMLRRTHLKNYEVAERVGYHDSRYFSQIFKKKVGLSPSAYRELAEK